MKVWEVFFFPMMVPFSLLVTLFRLSAVNFRGVVGRLIIPVGDCHVSKRLKSPSRSHIFEGFSIQKCTS